MAAALLLSFWQHQLTAHAADRQVSAAVTLVRTAYPQGRCHPESRFKLQVLAARGASNFTFEEADAWEVRRSASLILGLHLTSDRLDLQNAMLRAGAVVLENGLTLAVQPPLRMHSQSLQFLAMQQGLGC